MPLLRVCRGAGAKLCDELIKPPRVRCDDCHRMYVRARNRRPEHLARMDLPRTQRQRVYARDGYRCVDCGATRDLTIDHDPPLAEGLRRGKRTWRDDELRTLCRSCNSRLGGKLS